MGGTRFGVADHLGAEELVVRQRAARDPVERGWWQMIRLLVAGQSLAEVAEVTGYSTRWAREVVRRYNAEGPDGLADRRHANPGAAPLLDAEGRAAPSPGGGLVPQPAVALDARSPARRAPVEVQMPRSFDDEPYSEDDRSFESERFRSREGQKPP